MTTPQELMHRAAWAALVRLPGAEPLDVHAAYAPVGEAVMWACALEESLWDGPPDGSPAQAQTYNQRRDSHPDGHACEGLRHVRNSMLHHQTFSVSTANDGGLRFPLFANGVLEYDVEVFRWRDDLPQLRHKRQFECYREQVAGQIVGVTINRVLSWCRHELYWFWQTPVDPPDYTALGLG